MIEVLTIQCLDGEAMSTIQRDEPRREIGVVDIKVAQRHAVTHINCLSLLIASSTERTELESAVLAADGRTRMPTRKQFIAPEITW